MEHLPASAWFSAALAVLAVATGIVMFEPLPATTTWLWGVPPLVAGIGLWITSTFAPDIDLYGRLTAGLPGVHAVIRIVSALVAAAGLLWLLKQPGAEAGPRERVYLALQTHCHEPTERVERHLLERLELARSYGEDRWDPILARCLNRTREAFARPEGTHRSWEELRTFLAEQDLDDPVFLDSYRPIEHAPLPRAVELGR